MEDAYEYRGRAVTDRGGPPYWEMDGGGGVTTPHNRNITEGLGLGLHGKDEK